MDDKKIKNKFGKFSCACCGFFTLTEIKETCPVCFWEEDCFQEEYTDDNGGPNSVSLYEAKKNLKKYGAVEEEFKKYVRLPLEDEK